MSQRERFEFVSSEYHRRAGHQPVDDEAAYAVFCNLEARGETLQRMLRDIDEYLDPHLNDDGDEVCPFAQFLAGFILDEDEYQSVLASLPASSRQWAHANAANDNQQPPERKASGIDKDQPESCNLEEPVGHCPANDAWPKQSHVWSTIMAIGYPPYPGNTKPAEMKLVEAEAEKLRGKVAFHQILAGVARYAAVRKGDENYKKNLKLSAFLAQRKWEDQPVREEARPRSVA